MARFGIGEWFGQAFHQLTVEQRQQYAALSRQAVSAYPACPFQGDGTNVRCSKKGGVCTLRLYERFGPDGDQAIPAVGMHSTLCTTCPHRFKQGWEIFRHIGRVMLGTDAPDLVSEVRFLRRPVEAEAGAAEETGEDVGNIDMVLVHPTARPMQWCALEIQAVYFSGPAMGTYFDLIGTWQEGIPYPDKVRRPDYRSSGPKRLMPQLQIKVPTLRRWGKKMAVVVDRAWFRANVVNVETVGDLSNCDIAWFVVDYNEESNPVGIAIGEPEKQTLERAVEGLTGGFPVTLSEFEQKIQEKLDRPR